MKDKSNSLVVVLVSGGMDSLACVAIANEQYSNLALLHLNYGQKTEKKELEAFKNIAEHYNIVESRRKIIDVSFLKQIGGSSLTDPLIKVKKSIDNSSEIPDSYVPFRNTHIIAMAVSWSEVIQAKKIFIGAVEEDSSGYPDCRPSYYKAYNQLIKEGTKKQDIEIITPVIHMKKSEIIKKSIKLNAPLHLSWSCYAREDKSCGVCDSCALRLKGFKEANEKDPIVYVE